MDIYKINKIAEVLENNSYVGRGIIMGKSADGKNAVCAYFITGRSENSRNRVFEEKNGEVFTRPFDVSKVEDPSLIIYAAVRKFENKLIVTNGDQTDTIFNALAKGKCFMHALKTREFEPDEPNFTPRISGMITFADGGFDYKMSILKSVDAQGSGCVRCLFDYPAVDGLGHFIRTYVCNGDPIPSFQGEPDRVAVSADIDEFTNEIWTSLDNENKISLYVRYTDVHSGEYCERLINKKISG